MMKLGYNTMYHEPATFIQVEHYNIYIHIIYIYIYNRYRYDMVWYGMV